MIKKLIFFVSLFFLISPHVFADTVSRYYVQDTSSTKSTDWNPAGTSGNTWTYNNQYIIFSNESERYVTLSTCLTGNLDMEVTGNINGSISYQSTSVGSSCNVQGYNGAMYYFIFYVNEFYDAGNGNVAVYFNLKVTNNNTYKVVQDIFNVTSSVSRPTFENYDDQFNDINNNLGDINNNINDTNEKLDDLNDNITNDNVSGVEESFSQFEDFLDDNSTITQLITLPVTLYSSILQGVSNSCTPFNLGALYGESLILPCINIGNYLGSTLWGMIDLIISGFAIYSISKKLIKVFNNFSSMKDGDVIDD